MYNILKELWKSLVKENDLIYKCIIIYYNTLVESITPFEGKMYIMHIGYYYSTITDYVLN